MIGNIIALAANHASARAPRQQECVGLGAHTSPTMLAAYDPWSRSSAAHAQTRAPAHSDLQDPTTNGATASARDGEMDNRTAAVSLTG